MATLREIRRRINSIKSTQQVTKAMKMVAAAKLRRAQEKALAARPYGRKIEEMVQHLVATVDTAAEPLLMPREPRRVLLVAVTADRGLCGAFNFNIIKQTLHRIEFHKDKEVSLVCVGKKGYDFFSKRDYNVVRHFIQFFNNLEFLHARQISHFLVDYYLQNQTDVIEIVYNEFKNVVQQNLLVEQYLPLQPAAFEEQEVRIDYIYEPDRETLLKELLPRHLEMQMWRVLLESYASEQGARMTAMENATDNASELIHDLTLFYNRARQAAITKEITEIVGGAEALKSG